MRQRARHFCRKACLLLPSSYKFVTLIGSTVMSIFGSIMSAIFHHSAQAATAPGGSAAKPVAAGSSTAAGAPAAQGAKPAAAPPPASSAAPSSAPKGTVDVAAIMDKLAGQSKEKLDWRHCSTSIEPCGAQDPGGGTALHRQHRRLGDDERLAAQASDGKTRRERRQGPDELKH